MHNNWHPGMGDHRVSTDIHHEKRKKYEKRARILNIFLLIAAAAASLALIILTLRSVSG